MPRMPFALVALVAVLTACGVRPGDGDAEDAAPGDLATTASTDAGPATMPSPFETLLPWDGDAPEVTTTESGLQYRVITEGPADGASPTARDTVTVMYEGRLMDGTIFDSAYDRGQPATFPLDGVIAGWTEGLQYMSEGDEFMFFIPNALAYGDQARGGVIKAGDDLLFRVELQNVRPAPEPRAVDADAWATHLPWNSDHPDVMKTGTGLEFVVLAEGEDGAPSPEGGEMVVVHYEGRLADSGETFDSSFARGEPAIFPANRLIPGWVEALQLMKKGDRWLIQVPAELGYGDAGTDDGVIPPNSTLVFEVEMMDVLKTQ